MTSIRLASYPLVAVPNNLEAPFWRRQKQSTQHIISLRNGLIDLNRLGRDESCPLIPHTADFFVLSSLPYDYDPEAKCRRFHQFLDYALAIDPDLIWVMQEFYGLCLTHDMRFHAFLFLQGESRTGKGVAFEVLQALVGWDNVSSVPLRHFGGNFGLQPMLGKKLNINAEVPELDNVAEDIFKEYTGGSTMLTYHRKNKKSLITKQRARLAFSSNHYPNFKDRSEGIWNRMILIPFKNVVSQEARDPNLVNYLVDNELPGIFNWAMKGYARMVKNGGFTDSIVMCMEREEYRNETIPVRRFLKELIVLDEGSKVTNKELYPLYTKWAKMEGHHRQNAVTFGRDTKAYFKSIDIEQKKFTSGVRGYEGVSINLEMQDEILSFDAC